MALTPTPIPGTNLASAVVPFTTGDTFPTHHAEYGKGGWRSVPTVADLDLITDGRKEDGMVVYVIETGETFTWNATDTTWKFFVKGGDTGQKRQTITYEIANLVAGQTESFELEMAKSSIIYELSVSRVARVTAWSSVTKDETNPYIFSATEDHLADDGSMLLSDGSILRTRRYPIFVNLDDPADNKIYFDVENIDFNPGPVTLSITYLPMEKDLTL